MTWVDWVILAVLAGATFGGLAQGFFRTACSLAGLIFGLGAGGVELPASWLDVHADLCRIEAVANTDRVLADRAAGDGRSRT